MQFYATKNLGFFKNINQSYLVQSDLFTAYSMIFLYKATKNMLEALQLQLKLQINC